MDYIMWAIIGTSHPLPELTYHYLQEVQRLSRELRAGDALISHLQTVGYVSLALNCSNTSLTYLRT